MAACHLGARAAERHTNGRQLERAALYRDLGIQPLLRCLLHITAPRASRRVETAELRLRDTRPEPNFLVWRRIGEAADRRQHAPARHGARVVVAAFDLVPRI